MRLFVVLLTVFLARFTTVTARQPPTSFCKCICFTNSTIIPLNSSPSPSNTPRSLLHREEDADGHDGAQHKRLTCSDCTRAFCLDYNLPICKGAKEEDVFTTCFQRDSLKDETIVLLFIAVTTGLLGWAVVKPWLGKVTNNETMQRYAPVGNLNLPGLGRGGGLIGHRDAGENRHRAQDSDDNESFARQGGLNS